jgi:Rps23 Pro-64 3,4-dihydroxylase Tpa1-like proline 4-hydroxylase
MALDFEREHRKLRERQRREGLTKEIHQRFVDLARMRAGYPQRFDSYPGEGIPRHDEKRRS